MFTGDSVYQVLPEHLQNHDPLDEHEPGEPPPYDSTNLLGYTEFQPQERPREHQRFKCHICDPPQCSRLEVCHDAIQCWKSRIRENTGKFYGRCVDLGLPDVPSFLILNALQLTEDDCVYNNCFT